MPNFNKIEFTSYCYPNSIELFFDFDITEWKRTQRHDFKFCQTLFDFIRENPQSKIYITREVIENWFMIDIDEDWNQCFLVELNQYSEFCEGMKWTRWRAKAFFWNHITRAENLANLSEEDRKRIFLWWTIEQYQEALLEKPEEERNAILSAIPRWTKLSADEIITFISSWNGQSWELSASIENANERVKITKLKEYKIFIENNLGENETFFQNWIDGKKDMQGNDIILSDEDKKREQRSRRLIFGLEFIDQKREWLLSWNRFDMLTRLIDWNNEYVIFEFKSPTADAFDFDESQENGNSATTKTYRFSKELSRSIPQITGYKSWFENKQEWDPDLTRIGLKRGKIRKSIIVIGQHKDDDEWKDHFSRLSYTIWNGIDIITYTDLVNRLATTIQNLENNLL